MNVNGKVCVVTGGARGIGREIVDRFAAGGAKKVYACDVNIEALEGCAENVAPYVLNVTDVAAIAKFTDDVLAADGAIDVLVNNAGITRDGLLQNTSDEEWNLVVGINLKGVFNVTRAIAPGMVNAGSGSIINMASVVGVDGNIGQTNYSATKAGVIGMTKTWSKEFARKGAQVRVNALAPGFIATPMTEKVPQKVLDIMVGNTVLGRMGTPEDIANAAMFFASDMSSFITGQVLKVDGGLKL
ncbi:MAG: 3-oxoacyl-ACP reductase FabG [Spirochaetaceae bacterium]|nr:3-oxoacyl-ACP reductase FabG [Spirochaetaceae bacterium]